MGNGWAIFRHYLITLAVSAEAKRRITISTVVTLPYYIIFFVVALGNGAVALLVDVGGANAVAAGVAPAGVVLAAVGHVVAPRGNSIGNTL